jgi:hypothetical protein
MPAFLSAKHGLLFDAEDGSRISLCNAGELPDYVASHPRNTVFLKVKSSPLQALEALRVVRG